uniref:Uncharacterized protein n=1 Tax=Strigamia maritima TaxID=126957 RepID=T1IXS8_STRMM
MKLFSVLFGLVVFAVCMCISAAEIRCNRKLHFKCN